ncbi:hypothetical protein HNQ91_001454 [Filimonas zeae]|uniref:hypothetical protein n=1 Tax=Filimonas zeae TaxID=1737353 RepID=UPI0016673C96|nr:hypothetical protein [Filimonas zeae]MDR6338403.1 hypothetical protein [Filimonas zeae]
MLKLPGGFLLRQILGEAETDSELSVGEACVEWKLHKKWLYRIEIQPLFYV